MTDATGPDDEPASGWRVCYRKRTSLAHWSVVMSETRRVLFRSLRLAAWTWLSGRW